VLLAAEATNLTGDETVAPLAGELIVTCAYEVTASNMIEKIISQFLFKTGPPTVGTLRRYGGINSACIRDWL